MEHESQSLSPMEENIRLLLVDDHEIFLEGLVSLLGNVEGVEIIGTALNGAQALERIEIDQPDVLMTDLSMPEMDGVELVKKVKETFPDVKILVLTMHDDRETIGEIIMAEAEGYVLKNTSKKELVKGIQRVHSGGTFYSNQVMQIILERFQKREKQQEAEQLLTERELEILKLISEEKSSREIGDELNISFRTVDTHRKNLLKKTNTRTVIGLLKFGVHHSLISM